MSRARSIGALAALAVVVAAVAFLTRPGDPTPRRDLLFPDLAARVNAIDTIRLGRAQRTLTIERDGAGFSAVEEHGYPADGGVLRSLVLALSEARIVEPKTSRADLYHKLGVRDVSDPESRALAVRLLADGETLANVLIGNPRDDGSHYARVVGRPQSVLVSPGFGDANRRSNWLDREIVTLDRAAIREVEVERRGTGATRAVRVRRGDDGRFELQDVPPAKQVRYQYAVDDFAAAFAALEFERVRPADASLAESALVGRARTGDGLVIEFETFAHDDDTWFAFTAHAAENDPAAEAAQRLNARWDGWLYTLAPALLERLSKTMADLVEDRTPREATPGSGDG